MADTFREGIDYTLNDSKRKAISLKTSSWIFGKKYVHKGIQVWNLSIQSKHKDVVIGVASSNIQPTDEKHLRCATGYYLVNLSDFRLWTHDKLSISHQIIVEETQKNTEGINLEVTLDYDIGTLSFKLNGKNLGIAFSDISKSEPLSLRILAHEPDSITILDSNSLMNQKVTPEILKHIESHREDKEKTLKCRCCENIFTSEPFYVNIQGESCLLCGSCNGYLKDDLDLPLNNNKIKFKDPFVFGEYVRKMISRHQQERKDLMDKLEKMEIRHEKEVVFLLENGFDSPEDLEDSQ